MTSPARNLPAGVTCLSTFRTSRRQSMRDSEVLVITRGQLREAVNAVWRTYQANQHRESGQKGSK